MNKKDFFFYNASGYIYYLDPVWHTDRGYLKITGASLFNADGQYLGHWDAYNMPLSLLTSLKKWTKFNKSTEIAKSIGVWERERRQREF